MTKREGKKVKFVRGPVLRDGVEWCESHDQPMYLKCGTCGAMIFHTVLKMHNKFALHTYIGSQSWEGEQP